jgi:hypothetical protein
MDETTALGLLNEMDDELVLAAGAITHLASSGSPKPGTADRLRLRQVLALAALDVQLLVAQGQELRGAANKSAPVKRALHAVMDHLIAMQGDVREAESRGLSLSSALGIDRDTFLRLLQVPSDF